MDGPGNWQLTSLYVKYGPLSDQSDCTIYDIQWYCMIVFHTHAYSEPCQATPQKFFTRITIHNLTRSVWYSQEYLKNDNYCKARWLNGSLLHCLAAKRPSTILLLTWFDPIKMGKETHFNYCASCPAHALVPRSIKEHYNYRSSRYQ